MNNKTILVTGARGQLGKTLEHCWSASGLAADNELVLYDIEELDLTSSAEVQKQLNSINPHAIVNTAAYTAVDQAEQEANAALAVNATAVANLAGWATDRACRIVHISTDFVFDGKSNTPYTPEDSAAPLSVYGGSKRAGEVQLLSGSQDKHVIIRTSWLYSEYGKNFVKTMLQLMQEKDELGVVADQTGSPTSTHSLAGLVLQMLSQGAKSGIYHWTDGASISWYEFAGAIQAEGIRQGVLELSLIHI